MLRIQEAREAHGWTQERLANELGTTQQTVQRWETGAVDPKISKVIAISELLGVTVSYLLGTKSKYEYACVDIEDPNEAELVELYRNLTKEQQDAILALLRSM